MAGMAELRASTLGRRGQSDRFRALAAGQEGIVTRVQLLDAGLSSAGIDRALRSGRLFRVHTGVYAEGVRLSVCEAEAT
jgi:hypothetical protein